MQYRLSRSFLPWLSRHFFEFFHWYLGAIISLYFLHRLQLELPIKVRGITQNPSVINSSLVWSFLGIALGILVFRTLSRLLFFYPARVQQKLLRSEIIQALENTPPQQYQKIGQGQVYQILFNDINRLRGFVGFALLQLGNVIIAGVVLIPELLKFQSNVWMAFIPLLLSMAIFISVSWKLQKTSKEASFAQGEVQNFIMEVYQAKATIKNYHFEASFVDEFKKRVDLELKAFLKVSIGYAFSIPLIRLGLGFSLLLGAMILIRDGKGASDIIFFSGFLFLILEPLMFFSWMSIVTSDGLSAWKRIKDLWALLETKEDKKWEAASGSSLKVLFWENEIKFHLNKNTWLVFCGATGCGKSELLKKIAMKLKSQNKQVSMVQQDPFLFNDTVEANIFLGKSITEENRKIAQDLVHVFGLLDLAPNVNDILSLLVGENGKRLSGGERKRIALIRSLLSDAAFLVWDDPFSSVDILQERKIIRLIKEKFPTKTFILTSHRWTTNREAHELIFLDQDQGIRFNGSPEMALNEEYIKAFFHEQLV